MGYWYETHCHSMEGSLCSDFPATSLVHYYKKQGYSGIALTNHFTGNSALPDALSWEERVDVYYGIYETARAEGRRIGLDVFFGLECSLLREKNNLRHTTGNDFIFLGLTKEWLLANEHVFVPCPSTLFDAVHAAGGFIIHAHPFTEAEWVESYCLLPRKVDAVEIINGCRSDHSNEMARLYAEHYALAVTAASDLHHSNTPHVLACVETQQPCHTVEELIAEISARRVAAHRLGAHAEQSRHRMSGMP